MLYQIEFSNLFPNEEVAGKTFEVFRVSWAGDHWVRDDENGEAWGYDHPIRKECVRLSVLGKGETPDLTKATIGYKVVEIDPETFSVGPKQYDTVDGLLDDLGLEKEEVAFIPGLFEDEVKLLGPGDEENE